MPCHKVTTIQGSGLNWVVIILHLPWFSTICIVSIHGGGGKTKTLRLIISIVVELTWFQYLSVDTSSQSLLDPSLPAALNNKSLTGVAFKVLFCCFSMYVLDTKKAWTVLSIAWDAMQSLQSKGMSLVMRIKSRHLSKWWHLNSRCIPHQFNSSYLLRLLIL